MSRNMPQMLAKEQNPSISPSLYSSTWLFSIFVILILKACGLLIHVDEEYVSLWFC